MTAALSIRPAEAADLPVLRALIGLTIDSLQAGFLSPEQIAASHMIMGLDTQLVEDGTYFVVENHGGIVGCGGWSRRATLYGGDHSAELRNSALLDPSRDGAKIRAMYTQPDFARQGIGRLILSRCEHEASSEGFSSAELMATLSGRPLYLACGYEIVELVDTAADAVNIPLVRMRKHLQAR